MSHVKDPMDTSNIPQTKLDSARSCVNHEGRIKFSISLACVHSYNSSLGLRDYYPVEVIMVGVIQRILENQVSFP